MHFQIALKISKILKKISRKKLFEIKSYVDLKKRSACTTLCKLVVKNCKVQVISVFSLKIDEEKSTWFKENRKKQGKNYS